jgi:hypothetical protein
VIRQLRVVAVARPLCHVNGGARTNYDGVRSRRCKQGQNHREGKGNAHT